MLLRENSRKFNSFVIFSDDEGKTWTEPRELPGSLTGDRHVGKYAPDGRLFVSFRDTTHESPTKGDWVGWVGTYDDIVAGREGQYRVRLMDNTKAADCAYPGVEVLPDGTFVATTYGHWAEGQAAVHRRACGSRWRNSTPWRRQDRRRRPRRRQAPAPGAAAVTVADADGLRRALADAVPGTTIRIAPGTYRGGISARGLRGEPGRPIVLAAADPERPPVFEGGDFGLHLSDPAHVELHDLVVARVRGNGINIDDGGSPDTPGPPRRPAGAGRPGHRAERATGTASSSRAWTTSGSRAAPSSGGATGARASTWWAATGARSSAAPSGTATGRATTASRPRAAAARSRSAAAGSSTPGSGR